MAPRRGAQPTGQCAGCGREITLWRKDRRFCRPACRLTSWTQAREAAIEERGRRAAQTEMMDTLAEELAGIAADLGRIMARVLRVIEERA